MHKNRFYRMLTLGIRQFRDPYYQGFAAQISFYFMLSIVPILILLSQVFIGIFNLTLHDSLSWLVTYLRRYVSETLGRQLDSMMDYKGGRFGNVIYFFIALWAASGAQFSMLRITNFMFTEGKSTGKGYFRERFRAIANMLVFLVIIILAVIAMVFGKQILTSVGSHTGALMWNILRWPLALVIYFGLISYNYYVMPTDRIPYRSVIPGSIFASVGMVVVTMVYSYYASKTDYTIIYGVLGNIVAMMVWFYFLAWVLILGVLLNKVWMDTANGKTGIDEFF